VDVVRASIRREFGAYVPPFALHELQPELLGAVWDVVRDTLVAGRVPRALKEAVAAAVSEANRCPYCVDAHVTMLHAADRHDVADALLRGEEPAKAEYSATVAWARATVRPDDARLQRPPFGPAAAPELLGTALAFHYVNRMVNALLGPSPLPFNGRGRRVSSRVGGLFFARAVRRSASGAESPAAADGSVPAELDWARATPAVAAALARLAAAVGRAGERVLAEEAREPVREALADWRGEPAALGRGWAEERLAALEPAMRPAARLALLAALAPHQVDERLLSGEPAADIAALAWGSYAATARIASWVVPAAGLGNDGGLPAA
jgi:AhpD family alkylhydroperoxidase